MKFSSRFAVRAALSAALVLGAAAPTQAQATPIAIGHGSWIGANQMEHWIEFSLVQRPNGSVCGHAIGFEPATHAFIYIQLNSFMFAGDTLMVAGRIAVAINMPPQYPVGGTSFFAVNDNTGAPDGFAGLGQVPPQFGNLTIQQIYALIGSPPPQAFAPLTTGNIRIF